jgi:hypothetical protein
MFFLLYKTKERGSPLTLMETVWDSSTSRQAEPGGKGLNVDGACAFGGKPP